MTLEVIKPGLLTTLQDGGRPGLAHLGIGRSGAFDAPALRIANALCGNAPDACALEVTLLGPTLRLRAAAWIAVTGAPIALRINGIEQPLWAPLHAPTGATITLGAMRAGCRSYVAVRGGFDATPVLGSRSSDVNARLGPLGGRPVHAGDVLDIGPGSSPAGMARARGCDQGSEPASPRWRLDPRPWFSGEPIATVRLVPGTHFDRLAETPRKRLFSETFVVQKDSNRVGLRLAGPALEFDEPVEMISEGCVPGVLQLPPSGQPIAFGPECPVSGGYPRIGQVAAVDFPRLAQLRPGDALRFEPCRFDEALHVLREREVALRRLEAMIRHRLQFDDTIAHREPAASPPHPGPLPKR